MTRKCDDLARHAKQMNHGKAEGGTEKERNNQMKKTKTESVTRSCQIKAYQRERMPSQTITTHL